MRTIVAEYYYNMQKLLFLVIPFLLWGCEKTFDNLIDVSTENFQVTSVTHPASLDLKNPGDSILTARIKFTRTSQLQQVFFDVIASDNSVLNPTPIEMFDISDNLFSAQFELEREYPNYYFYMSGKEMAIFSKTPIKIIRTHTSTSNSNLINLKINNLNFYAIDVQGDQDAPRKKELGFIEKLITKKENTIILGDFNAPYESKFLDKIKTNFNHAFNEKGNGFRETWFWNIPLLSLDHIWISQDLGILKTKKTGTFKSDHNMIKTYIRN